MTPVYAFIAVGSNINPLINIPLALDLLRQQEDVIASSTFYQTIPVGPSNQPIFINGVWCIKTVTPPAILKAEQLADIEKNLGRVRTEDKYAPRTIDLDLILYGDHQCQEVDVQLPHPDLKRPFVLGPILELMQRLHLTNLAQMFDDSAPSAYIGQPLDDLTRELCQALIPK